MLTKGFFPRPGLVQGAKDPVEKPLSTAGISSSGHMPVDTLLVTAGRDL